MKKYQSRMLGKTFEFPYKSRLHYAKCECDKHRNVCHGTMSDINCKDKII